VVQNTRLKVDLICVLLIS